ncbi:hypothetical protein UAS_01386 [Enterococcus asini ATCC 700915]|uniref:HTH araC/xylS-type domain-containing protein n=1 Tax=Enterococcus asini ATCC 700915 TaxID=1158606 RepID=R2PUG8_9ENTE|nr:helix-turn-helix domain-containing protein [Enterococcus asini]EOH86923.1 hypothetical protein UAS_01386 [Enterococcus asini ATCC 700915]EOT58154.1 hypothetical protein I579_01716 [Enterococcus asini ATCC 700915]
MRQVHKLRKSKFFYGIFLPIFLIGMVLILGFAGYIYQSTYDTIFQNLVNTQKSNGIYIRNHLEQQVKTIEYSFSAYSTTDSFKQAVKEDLDYRKYDLVHQLKEELSYIQSIGIDSGHYSIISLQQGWEISDSGFSQLDSEEVQEYKDLVSKSSTYLRWLPTKKGITMLVSLPVFEQTRNGLGVAELNQHFLAQATETAEGAFYLLDSDGESLYQHQGKLPSEVKNALADTEETQAEGMITAKNGDLYPYVKSDYNHWIYVTNITRETIAASLLNLRIGLVVLVLLMLVLLSWCAYILAERSVRPIREIKGRLSQDSDEQLELGAILNGIDTIKSQNEIMATTVRTQQPALKTLFMLDLFRKQTHTQDIEKRLKQFGYANVEPVDYLLALLKIDDMGDRKPEETEVILLAISKMVEELVPREARLHPIVTDSETQATIFRIPKTQTGEVMIREYCQKIQQAIEEFLRVTVSFGLSKRYAQLTTSHSAVQEATEALHFRINLGSGGIIFYEEIAQGKNKTEAVRYPQGEEQLIDAIRAGDRQLVDKLFPQVIQEIFQQNHQPLAIEMVILNLSNHIIQLGQLLGADLNLFHQNRSIYYHVLQLDHPKDITKVLYNQLILPIIDSIQNTTDHEMKSLTDKMLQIVHQSYDQDLSLEAIADQLHYNPNYLSGIFKREYGSNFGDYVLSYRLSVAKRWLVESKMTIKEISERLQYNNPQNFIRFFKKKEGMTPGEYRKAHQ